MVNFYNDLDFNGSLFHYKGHCVNILNNYVLDDILVKYFLYNGNNIYIDPDLIEIRQEQDIRTGLYKNKKRYRGLFYDNVDDYLAYVLSGKQGFEIKTQTVIKHIRPEDKT